MILISSSFSTCSFLLSIYLIFFLVKNILENSSYIDFSDTGKSPLFLTAEKGYRDILALKVR
jgi:hypothetical protein